MRILLGCSRRNLDMREMVLNHTSLSPPDRATAVGWLRDVAVGMSVLVGKGVANPALRSSLWPYEISCLGTWTLNDLYQALRAQGARDEYVFLLRLGTKAPLLGQVAPELEDRFLRCEDRTLASSDGEPLLFCAISDGIAIGFPSNPIWDQSALTVNFTEILPDGAVTEASETIDNLTRSTHAGPIFQRSSARIRAGLLQVSDGGALWRAKGKAFPNLTFGLDVESHLTRLNTGDLGTIVNRLASLDDTAANWCRVKDDMPPWRTKVTNETSSVRDSPVLRQSRQFRSSDGSPQWYFWHARYGGGGRIHLRFVRSEYRIEIGYIGPHLPL